MAKSLLARQASWLKLRLMRALESLGRYVRSAKRSRRSAHETCEICGGELRASHSHVFEKARRALLCACQACATLFSDSSASGGRYRRVPDCVLSDPAARLDDAAWAGLGVPVGLAFIVPREESEGGAVAFYPSPAGLVEADVDAEAWCSLQRRVPLAKEVAPQVEALLVRRRKDGLFDLLVAPIDACFRLVGEVRTRWRGIDGGDEARGAIDAFFLGLRDRARPLRDQGNGAR